MNNLGVKLDITRPRIYYTFSASFHSIIDILALKNTFTTEINISSLYELPAYGALQHIPLSSIDLISICLARLQESLKSSILTVLQTLISDLRPIKEQVLYVSLSI